MEKHLFILYGTGNTGKTTTLNLLFKKACEQFSDNLVYFRRNRDSADFCAVFQHGNIKIGLYSSGDNEWNVSHNLYELNHQHCNLFLEHQELEEGVVTQLKTIHLSFIQMRM